MDSHVEAHPEEEEQRAAKEGQPRAQAQHGSQLLTRRAFQIRGISLCEDPQAWSAIGFEVTSHTPTDAATRVRLGNTTVVLTGKGVGFEGWTVDGITESIDGITSLGPALDEPARSEATHPNGITAIDHVVVGTGDIGRTSAALDGAGLRCRRERSTTAYGSHMRQRFYWLGDVILELVGPDEGETTDDERARIVGLALVSADLDATVSALGDLAGTPKDAVQEGRRIAGIRGDAVGVSIPLAVMSPHPGRTPTPRHA